MHTFWAHIDLLIDFIYEYVENLDCDTIASKTLEMKIQTVHEQILECICKMSLNDKMWIKEDLKNHNFNSNIIENKTVFNYILNLFDIYDKEL